MKLERALNMRHLCSLGLIIVNKAVWPAAAGRSQVIRAGTARPQLQRFRTRLPSTLPRDGVSLRTRLRISARADSLPIDRNRLRSERKGPESNLNLNSTPTPTAPKICLARRTTPRWASHTDTTHQSPCILDCTLVSNWIQYGA